MSPNADTPSGERGCEATVIASLPNSMFRLRLPDGRVLTGHAALDTRKAFVRLVAGDVVRIETSPFDRNRARIVALVDARRSKAHRASAARNNPFPAESSPRDQSPSGQRELP